MSKNRPNPIIRLQSTRIRRHFGFKRGGGDHLNYIGYHIVEGEALMDVFHYWRDEWVGAYVGYPMYIMIDVSGTDIRYSTFEETELFMGQKLDKRKPTDEDCFCI